MRGRTMPLWSAVLVVCLGAIGGASVISLIDPSDDLAVPPAAESPQADPNMSVSTVQVNGRTVSCVMIDPPGAALAMSCDWTREAS